MAALPRRIGPPPCALRDVPIWLPSLYSTPTIRRYYYPTRDRPSDAQTSRRRHPAESLNVPFERLGDHAPSEVRTTEPSDPDRRFEASTITPSERHAFEKLFEMRRPPKREGAGGEEGDNVDPDAALDPARDDIAARALPQPRFPPALRPLAEAAFKRRRDERSSAHGTLDEADAVSQAADRDRVRVANLLQQAHTAAEVWETLRAEVLARVAALQLDPVRTPLQRDLTEGRQRRGRPPGTLQPEEATAHDLRVLTRTLPRHLRRCMDQLRTRFPSSHLALLLLPTLKKLGPAAFALGAATPVYNAHILALHRKYPTSPHLVLHVLREMDEQVYAFDEDTVWILDKIWNDARKFSRGHAGEGVRAAWATERMRRGLRELGKWRVVAEERRQEEALRKAREEEGGGRVGFA